MASKAALTTKAPAARIWSAMPAMRGKSRDWRAPIQ